MLKRNFILGLIVLIGLSVPVYAYMIKASEVRVNSAGFDGNLLITDDDLQKVVQKLDDLTGVGGEGGSPNLDGGDAFSAYAAVTAIDGGGA